jgi:glycosyltransferase involved in cell wall biosynthesis
MMRILHVYSGNLFGGIEAILVAIARSQASWPALQHEFALSFHGRLERELAEAGAAVHHLGPVRMSRPATVRAARGALARLLEVAKFDGAICHAPWSQGILGGVVRRAELPLAFWAHDRMTGRHWTERLARRVVPDLAICNSRFTAETLPSLYPRTRSVVVYAPVDVDRLHRPHQAGDVRLMRASLSTPEAACVIVQVSRSERWKGHSVLIEALAELRQTPDWIWWQVGGAQRPAEAEYLAALKRQARQLRIGERVRWLGERTDVPALLGAADVYCQPNLEPEPFGIAFVEALGAGVPVVTSHLGGAREIVDESCGVLVEPRNPAALADALRRLVADRASRLRLGAAGPLRARALCEPAASMRRLSSALAEMLPAEIGA